MNRDKVTLADIFTAKDRLEPVINQTPLISVPDLSTKVGSNVYYKLETMQETHSFKVRGAGNVILNLSPEQQSRGVVTYSTGNHGRATAHVARLIGSQAKICLSHNVPENKREGIKESGGELVIYGDSQDEATKRAQELVKEEGLALVDPINDPYTIAGHGTIGLEIIEELTEVDTVLVPVSGGALISGIAMTIKSINPDCRIYGVSMEEGAAMYESQEAGEPVEVEEVDSLADSLQGGILLDNQYTFDMVERYVDDIILVSEEEIGMAITYAFIEDKIILEGAGAVGIAALLNNRIPNLGNSTVIIASGGNIDNNLLLSLIQRYKNRIEGLEEIK